MNQVKEKLPCRQPEADERLTAVRAFAHQCEDETEHREQVAYLAECLFDGLKASFGLSAEQRFWLTCGAILHDIGWIEGQPKHHKASMQMILDDTTMPLTDVERNRIAMVARYHRRSLPKPRHPLYCDLNPAQRMELDFPAGLVRLADGLDRTHTGAVQALAVQIQPNHIQIVCKCNRSCRAEIEFGDEKADLLRRVTGCSIEITEGH